MLAVIFRATVVTDDARYAELGEQLRRLALEKYHCREFFALCEGDQEVAISYWDDEAHIRAWKQDADHRTAQALGRDQWYSHYQVQVTQIIREYAKPAPV